MKQLSKIAAAIAIATASLSAQAGVTQISTSHLVASTGYYTDTIGGGIGNVVVTTGGGNASNVGGANGRNDDGFAGAINLGFNFSLFGQTYTSLFINNNGNVTFGGGLSEFRPQGPTATNMPIIAPFFADIDTRNLSSGVMHLRQDVPGQAIITWDNVGHFNSQATATNSFQLVLRSADYATPIGEGSIGFFYKNMGWEKSQSTGLPVIGFGNGTNDGFILAGSSADGIKDIVANHHIWFNERAQPAEVPEPTSIALLGLGLAGLAAARKRRSRSAAL